MPVPAKRILLLYILSEQANATIEVKSIPRIPSVFIAPVFIAVPEAPEGTPEVKSIEMKLL